MGEKKYTIEELASLNDGTNIDLNALYDVKDNSENLLQDEIAEFIEKQKIRKNNLKNNSFFNVPKSDLKNAIENVIKKSNIREEILKKQAQYDFDSKMARIRKIKSKTYRKMRRREKLKKMETLESNIGEDESNENSEDENIDDFRPVISFENKKNDDTPEETLQQKMVAEAFNLESEECEKEFLEEKKEIIVSEAPQILETVLPGWDDWAGEGIDFNKNKKNTILEFKEGIKNKDRQDFNKNNVIINEKTVIPDKYLSKLPYGHTYKEYKSKLNTTISLETTSLRIFHRFLNNSKSDDSKFGKDIEPSEFCPEY